MTNFWRQAGLNYVQYSAIAARVVRAILKPEFKAEAKKRAEHQIRLIHWRDGKMQRPDGTFE